MSEIRYLNTDLDVAAVRNLVPLAEALTARGMYQLHPPHDREGRCFVAFETDTTHSEPQTNISEMLDAIESLTDDIAALWSECSLREFNIGYDCGSRPRALHNGLSNDVVRRVAAAGATVRFTLYAPESSAAWRKEAR